MSKLWAGLMAVTCLLARPATAQELKKDILSPSQAALASWNEIGRKLVAMAEDFPEDKYDFKPTPAERSFAEQLLHVAGSNDVADAGRQLDAPDATDKQRNTDFVFQITDLSAERWLCGMQSAFGSNRHAAFLGDSHEVAKVA